MEELRDSVSVAAVAAAGEDGGSVSLWVWIGLAVALAVAAAVFVFYRLESRRQKELAKANIGGAAAGGADMSSLLDGMFKARPLYEAMIRKVHPDRFAGDDDKVRVAVDLSQRISASRTDYSRLLALKEEAESKLGVEIM